jgi:Tol biopolymer transport system component/DNA-binding winged helix-turn-helix (wHTH) protein
MEELTTAKRVLRFGLYEVDFASQELRKSGIKIKIQDQPFQILALLLERPGQIITREEIQKRLWAGDTFVDFDLGLNSAVKKLRQVLGDESDNPRFIETLYRRGYRFLAPVQNESPASAEISTISPQAFSDGNGTKAGGNRTLERLEHGAPQEQNSRKLLAYLFVLILLGLGFLGGYWLRPPSSPRITGYQQITRDGRQKYNITSDGERLYLGEYDFGRFGIAQVSATGGETATLQTPFSQTMMGSITPDGSALLVGEFHEFHGMNKQALVWFLPLPTGAPRRLGDLVAESLAPFPDGLVFSKADGVYEAGADGSHARQIFSTDGAATGLAVSPDGQKISFTLTDRRKGTSRIWVVNRDGSNSHPLFPNEGNSQRDCCAKWTPDGKQLLFERYLDGHNNIWVWSEREHWFNRQPQALQLTNGPLDFSMPVPSRDGKKIFAVGAQPRTELVRYDGASAFKAFLGGLSATDLAFSTDGQWVSYVTVPDRVLWRSRVDGSERMQLTEAGKISAGLPRWSPDGKQIVFMGRTLSANWRAYLISANGGTFQDLVPEAAAGIDPGWTPDGNSIVLSLTNQGSTGRGISVLDLQTRKVSDLPGAERLFSPRVSPDGKYIAAITTDSKVLMLFDVTTQRWAELVRMPIGYPSWSHNGQYLYFDSIFSEDPAFCRIRISDHKLERLVSLSAVHRFWGELGEWAGLAPDDSLLIARDASNEEVYALEWLPH